MPFDGSFNWSETVQKTGNKGATALEVVNGRYEALSAKVFLHIAFTRAKRLEELRR